MTDHKKDDREKMAEAWKKWGVADADISSCPPAMQVSMMRHACMIGYCEKIEELYPHVRRHNDFREILQEAAKGGMLESVKTLVTLGANNPEDMGIALVEAAAMRWPEIVGYLISQGADAAASNGLALDHAAENKDTKTLGVLLSSGRYSPAMICDTCIAAAKEGNKEVVAAILDHGAFSIRFDDDRLLRHVARHTRAIPDMLEFLIVKGANVHAGADAALFAALAENNIKNIAALVDMGADPAVMTGEGWDAIGKKSKNIQDMMVAAAKKRQEEALELYKSLTMPDDMTRIVFGDNITGLIVATRAGKLDEAITALIEKSPGRVAEILNAPLLADRSQFGLSFLDLAVRTGQHKALFKPAIWTDRVTEMRTLCGCLPHILQQEILTGPVYGLVQKELVEKHRDALKNKTNKFRLPKPGSEPGRD